MSLHQARVFAMVMLGLVLGGVPSVALGVTHGFLAEGTTSFSFTQIDVPGATSTLASGINDLGQIVGSIDFESGFPLHGFLKTGGTFTQIDRPGATGGTSAGGINLAGQIVGAFDGNTGPEFGYLLSGGTFTDIKPMPLVNSNATGISTLGVIVGARNTSAVATDGYIRDSGGGFTLFHVPGATETNPGGISEDGSKIAGSFKTSPGGALHGFLKVGDIFTQIDVPLALQTLALGVNDAGTIVGEFSDLSSKTHGFRLAGGVFTSIDVPGALSTEAFGINDSGEIVGLFNGELAASVAEPATLVLVGAGLGVLLGWRRRRTASV